jgi:hypothetical protein
VLRKMGMEPGFFGGASCVAGERRAGEESGRTACGDLRAKFGLRDT